jgi:hypothetical protein
VTVPPSPVEFSSHCCFHKLSHSWLLGGALHSCFLWPSCLFTVHMGSGPSPLSCGIFFPPPLLQVFPLLVAGRVMPLLPSPAGLFIYSSVGDCPSPPLRHSWHLALFVMYLFCCLLFSFSFFLGWGSVCPGHYADLAQDCLWEYHVPLSSPCSLHLPKQSGCWRLVPREPSWFLCLMWSGNAMRGLGVWRSQSFASSWWFFL